MRTVLVPLILSLAIASAVAAKTPEEEYLAQRDAAIAALKKKWGDCEKIKDSKAMWAEAAKLQAPLEAELRRLIDVPAPRGFAPKSAMSPASLYCAIDADTLDGLAFLGADSKRVAMLTISTEGLLKPWLVAHRNWLPQEPMPVEPEQAFLSEAFYTQAVSADAHVAIFGPPLSFPKPPGAKWAVALPAQAANGMATQPGQLALAVVRGGKVYAAVVDAETRFKPIPACAALAGKMDDSLQKCWRGRITADPAFATLAQEAEAAMRTLVGR